MNFAVKIAVFLAFVASFMTFASSRKDKVCAVSIADGKVTRHGECVDASRRDEILRELKEKVEMMKNRGNTSTKIKQCVVLFVVDGSASITVTNFNLVRQWLVDVSAALLETQNTVRRIFIEVLQFSQAEAPFVSIDIADSTVFEIPFKFGECENITCITTGVNSMRYLSAQTFTYYALRRAREVELKNPAVGDADKIIVVLVDGDATDGINLPTWHAASVADGITTYAVGVGNQIQRSELRIIANGGSTDDRVLAVDRFNELSTITSILTNQILNSDYSELEIF